MTSENLLEYIEKFNERLDSIGKRATQIRFSNGHLHPEIDSVLDNMSCLSDYFSGLIYPEIKSILVDIEESEVK